MTAAAAATAATGIGIGRRESSNFIRLKEFLFTFFELVPLQRAFSTL